MSDTNYHIKKSAPASSFPKSALFLDRDGVINVNHGYVFKTENFDWIDGIKPLAVRAKLADMLTIVVTNQSGIGRGFYSVKDFKKLSHWMTKEFDKAGAKIDNIYYCPHHPSEAVGEYKRVCECRKPQIGMIKQACTDYNIDLTTSVMVGDKASDMHFAINAGITHAYWLNPAKHEISKFIDSCHLGQTKIHQIQHLDEIVIR